MQTHFGPRFITFHSECEKMWDELGIIRLSNWMRPESKSGN